jgi:hypothetical protein
VKVAVRAYGVTRFLPRLYRITPESTEPELKILNWNPRIRVRIGQVLKIIGTGFSDTASENKITFIYRPNTDLTLTVDGESVEQLTNDEKSVSLTVPDFKEYNKEEMYPAGTGTQYDVELHIGSDITKIAKGMNIQIRPPLS